MGVQPSQDFFQNFEVDMDQNFRNSPKLALITKIFYKKFLKLLARRDFEEIEPQKMLRRRGGDH